MHRIKYTYNAKNNCLQAITAVGINSSTYGYDAIGNLANDSGESVSVTWNAMNKVKQVNLPNNRQLQFSYSPTGQRQIKRSTDKTEYYLHDATGNIMCVYELSGKYLTVKERTIYGSKRIGVYRQRIQLTAFTGFGQAVLLPGSGLVNVLHPSPIISPDGRQYLEGSNRLQVIGVNRAIAQTSIISYAYKKGTVELKGLSPSIAARPTFLDGTKTAGLRDYELTDHLSNVMAVISDRKLSVDTNNDNITDYYEPQVVSYTDYYPFGFPIAERSGNLSGYRFGFNGQESDNEVYGVKTTYAFEYRMQDTRLGRFWSVDPLAGKFPMLSVYQFASNNPIWMQEIEGLEGKPTSVSEMDYEKLEKNYPDNGQEIIRKEGSALNYLPEGTNTCAIRMSECFNKAGYEVPSSKETQKNIRIQTGNKYDNGNFILDAKSMSNFLNTIEEPTYKFINLTTNKDIENAIKTIHKSDDLKGIMILTTENVKAYGATGHVDLIYEDFWWDLSIYSYNGYDLIDYLKEHKEIKFTLEIWVLKED